MTVTDHLNSTADKGVEKFSRMSLELFTLRKIEENNKTRHLGKTTTIMGVSVDPMEFRFNEMVSRKRLKRHGS